MELVVTMDSNLVEHRESGFYLVGSRVPIDRVVREYRDGEGPEAIRSEEVEKVLAERKRVEDEFGRTHPAPPHQKAKIERAREQQLTRRS